MIVKNESHVITRALESVWDIIDAWCIVDTGSTDDTQAIIESFAAGRPKPGCVVHQPWENFGVNRTSALATARARFPHIRWQWMMDADDFYSGPAARLPFESTTTGATAGIELQLQLTPEFVFQRVCIFRTMLPWKYVGVMHEYPMIEGPCAGLPTVRFPRECTVQARREGARSNNPNKYADDAKVLEAALLAEPTNMRYEFYCGQSWRDAGNGELAIPHYLRTAKHEGVWHEERYVSYLNLVRLESNLDVAVTYAWAGYELNPLRREIPYAILHKARVAHGTAVWRYDLLALGLASLRFGAEPDAIQQAWLFVEAGAFGWALYDEVGMVAFYKSQPGIALWAFTRGLALAPDPLKPHMQNQIDVTLRVFPGTSLQTKI